MGISVSRINRASFALVQNPAGPNDARANATELMHQRAFLFSTGRMDTGLNTAENGPLFAFTKGPEEDLKCRFEDLKGMTDADKNEGGVALYPPDIIIQRLWRNDRARYESLKREMHANPKCKDLDVFTEALYTSLRATTQADYQRKVSVSFKDALGADDARKRILEKEQFGRFSVPVYEEETSAHSVNIAVSHSYHSLSLSHIINAVSAIGTQEFHQVPNY
jgi:hypothetical protein